MNHTSLKTLYATAVAVIMTITTPSWGAPEDEDIAIIGSGSSAFAAAIHASSKGAKVTMIEEGTIGGTCVNVGCVPSKIFIQSGKTAHTQREHPFDGVEKHEPTINFGAMRRQQQARVLELRESKYVSVLEGHPNIKFLQGTATLLARDKVAVRISADETVELKPTKILIATGSTPTIPAITGLADTPFWTSTEALASEELPHHLVVLGGSVVALELAQAFAHHGSKVTLLARSTLLSKEDPAIGESLKSIFEREGIDVLTHTVPDSISHADNSFQILLGERTLTADKLLVATGRGGNTRRLGLDTVGIETDSQGKIIVDNHLRTGIETIFASGDCSDLPQYVYVAAAAGMTAAINMLGGDSSLDLSIVPGVTFTEPQVATVGLSVQQAEVLGIEVDSKTLTLDNVPRALANFDTQGFIKLVAQRDTGEILGAQIVASGAGDVIQTAAMAIRSHMTVREMASQLFPYLTMVEGLKLCAQTFFTDVKKLSCCASTVE